MIRALLFLVLLAGPALAQTKLWTTNEITTPDGAALALARAETLRLTVTSTDGITNNYSLVNKTVWWHISDAYDAHPLTNVQATVLDAAGGVSRVIYQWPLTGQWNANLHAYNADGSLAAVLSRNLVTVFAPTTLVYSINNSVLIDGVTAGGGSGGSTTSIVSLVVTSAPDPNWEVDLEGDLQPKDLDRGVSPRGSNTASIGTADKPWANAHIRAINTSEILINNLPVTLVPEPSGAVPQILQYDGSVVYWGNLYGPTPAGIGTNRVYFTNVVSGGITYTWTVPVGVTTLVWHVWGAAGGGGGAAPGGAGGYLYIIMPTVPGAQYDIINGNGGTYNANLHGTISGGYPGGGYGRGGPGGGQVSSGGGHTAIFISGTTTLVGVAASGAAGMGARQGPPGGGIYGTSGSALASTTTVAGARSRAINVYSGHTNDHTANVAASAHGQYLAAGVMYTNSTVSYNARWGGAGSGYIGGGAIAMTNSGAHSIEATGGSGTSWANSNLVYFASTTRGINHTPAGTELPAFVSGRGVGSWSTGSGNGLVTVEY